MKKAKAGKNTERKARINGRDRRNAVQLLATAGLGAWLGPAIGGGDLLGQGLVCVDLLPAETEGPYFVDERLNRSDIRPDPVSGAVKAGVPLVLKITVQNRAGTSCGPLVGSLVDIWHCDAAGLYSDVAANNTVGQKFLRGYQATDANGVVNFTTIYPGWYSGRAVHIHVKVRTFNGTQAYDSLTSQFFFDEALTDIVHAQSPYNTRGRRNTLNSNDMVYLGAANASRGLLTATAAAGGGYEASIVIGVDLRTISQVPSVNEQGVVNNASFSVGSSPLAPGSIAAIFGTGLNDGSSNPTSSFGSDGQLARSLGGAGVSINGIAAPLFSSYPTQLNVQIPQELAGVSTAGVLITVNGQTSASRSVPIGAASPGIFALNSQGSGQGAIQIAGTTVFAAVAGSITGAQAQPAQRGQSITIYCTGLGTVSNAPATGRAALSSPVSATVETPQVSIGGVPATVSFAGLAPTFVGLYQVNAVIPTAAPVGNAVPVVLTIAGASSNTVTIAIAAA